MEVTKTLQFITYVCRFTKTLYNFVKNITGFIYDFHCFKRKIFAIIICNDKFRRYLIKNNNTENSVKLYSPKI